MLAPPPPPPPPPLPTDPQPRTQNKPPPPPSSKPPSQHHSSHRGQVKPSSRSSQSQKHEDERKRAERKEKEKAAAAAAAAAAQQNQQGFQLDARLRRDTPFLATIRFKNDLPEIPGDPKLLVTQQAPEKLAAFNITTLEKQPKRDLILPPDLGITISLLDAERYQVPASQQGGRAQLHPADAALLGGEDEAKRLANTSVAVLARGAGGVGGSGRAAPPGRRHTGSLRQAAEVSWLMRTTYISADSDAVRKQGYNEKAAKSFKQAAQAEEQPEEDEEAMRARQIASIEASFAAARKPPVHRTKPHMKAVEVMDVLPDWECWGRKNLLTHFDNDPCHEVEALASLPDQATRRQIVARSLMKGCRLSDDVRFMALVVPKVANPRPQTEELPAEEVEGEYQWAKEYMYDLGKEVEGRDASGAARKHQSYLLRFTEGAALYCDVHGVMELRKRDAEAKARAKGGEAAAAASFDRPCKVTVRRREQTAAEEDATTKRRRVLLADEGLDL